MILLCILNTLLQKFMQCSFHAQILGKLFCKNLVISLDYMSHDNMCHHMQKKPNLIQDKNTKFNEKIYQIIHATST